MLQPKDTDELNGYKNKTHIYAVYKKIHFRPQATYRLKVRRWKNTSHANGKQKKVGVAILISDKIDFKIKKFTRDKEGHYIMIKGSIQEKDITINCKYLCTHLKSPSMYKINTNRHKRRN